MCCFCLRLVEAQHSGLVEDLALTVAAGSCVSWLGREVGRQSIDGVGENQKDFCFEVVGFPGFA